MPGCHKSARITSYNVCYTKLLRSAVRVDVGVARLENIEQGLAVTLDSAYINTIARTCNDVLVSTLYHVGGAVQLTLPNDYGACQELLDGVNRDGWDGLVRITSYNVCYTKLLRVDGKPQLQMTRGYPTVNLSPQIREA